MDKTGRKKAVALLSVVSNTMLVVSKLIVGLMTRSISVMSEAIHSGIDLVAALIALYAVGTSGKPADRDHPFGHGKIENASGVVEALLIFLAAGWIISEAIHKILRPVPLEKIGWGFLVMLISVVMNIVVSRLLFRVGRETDSMALQADAWHLRTDVWTSLGVMGALGLISLGQWGFPSLDLRWVDPVAAIGVAALIIRAAYDLTIQAGRDLLDASLPDEEAAWIRNYLASLKPDGYDFHRLRTRKAGATRFIEFHLLVNPALSVEDSHSIADQIDARIQGRFAGSRVTIHIEPRAAADVPESSEETLTFEEE